MDSYVVQRRGSTDAIKKVCAEAVSQRPDNLRLQYQLVRARALFPDPNDKGTPGKNFAKAVWLAEKGYPGGAALAGFMLHHGIDVDTNEKKALEYYQKAIHLGSEAVLGNKIDLILYSNDSSIAYTKSFFEVMEEISKKKHIMARIGFGAYSVTGMNLHPAST